VVPKILVCASRNEEGNIAHFYIMCAGLSLSFSFSAMPTKAVLS
jgi:hypothetical protein